MLDCNSTPAAVRFNVKTRLEQHLAEALFVLKSNGLLPKAVSPTINVTRSRHADHGDYSSNLAMLLANSSECKPREIGQALIAALPLNNAVRDVVVAGPGFINFYLAGGVQTAVINHVLEQGSQFGRSDQGAGRKLLVENIFVNATGPLYAGHGREAVLGDAIASLLQALGFAVERVVRIEDASRQMDILAVSVWLRYLEQCGEPIEYPGDGIQGYRINRIASILLQAVGHRFNREVASILADLHPNKEVETGSDCKVENSVSDPEPVKGSPIGSKELTIDALIQRTQDLLGEADYLQLFNTCIKAILAETKADLGKFGIQFECNYSETEDVGLVVEKQFARGYEKVVYVSGVDRQIHAARRKAAAAVLGLPDNALEFLQVQPVALRRGSQRSPLSAQMDDAPLRELFNEMGKDAARYFYLMHSCRQHLDIDLELVATRSIENPLYCVQYAHARICSVERQFCQRGLKFNRAVGLSALSGLIESGESNILTLLSTYPGVVERAAHAQEPHQLIGYLRDLANALHSYYNAYKILVEDTELRCARFCLLLAVRQVLVNGLTLIDVSTSEVM